MGQVITEAPELAERARGLEGRPSCRILWGWVEPEETEGGMTENDRQAWAAKQRPVRVAKIPAATVVLLGNADQAREIFTVLIPQVYYNGLSESQADGLLQFAMQHIQLNDSGNYAVNRDAYDVLFGVVKRGADLTWLDRWEDFCQACAALAPQPELPLFSDERDRQGYVKPNPEAVRELCDEVTERARQEGSATVVLGRKL